ncbi:helix-turn-helix domain-containing protein [Paenibacillus yanchengensis]|uniref:Helix-turn-helix domain-containing protein n=1 Tax=Paenibacillus yanchengensis TaxID=2035833 RepID=A0ABW4YIS1_9BACL
MMQLLQNGIFRHSPAIQLTNMNINLDSYYFLYSLNGNSQLKVKSPGYNGELLLARNDGILFNSNVTSIELLGQSHDEPAPLVKWCRLPAAYVKPLIDHAELHYSLYLQAQLEETVIEQWFTQLNELSGETSSATLAKELSLLYGWLAMFLERLLVTTTGERYSARIASSSDDQQLVTMERALAYIHEHYDQSELSVAKIAAYTGLERSYFTKVFAEKIKQPPGRYLQHYRLKQATMLLRQSGLPIKAIAYQSGFNDPEYFAQVFKQKVGQSPTQYRKQIAVT